MKFVLNFWPFLFFVLNIFNIALSQDILSATINLTSEVTTTTTEISETTSSEFPTEPTIFDYTLDFQNQTQWPWSMSIPDFEDWFFYYDNLTKEGLTNFSTKYFEDIVLTNVESADGIWVAFYSEEYSPIFGIPFIEFSSNTQLLKTLEFTCYIHGTGNILLEEGDKTHVFNHSDYADVPKWETVSLDLTAYSFKLLLMPNEENDFILIDNIIIHGSYSTATTFATSEASTTKQISTSTSTQTITTTIATTTAATIDQEYILNNSNQSSSPWSVSLLDSPKWFDYFDDLREESISDFAKDYFKSHNVELDQLQVSTIEGIWVAFHTVQESIQPFPTIQLSGVSAETIELNYYVHQNATIRLYFWDPEECFEFKQMNQESVPSWQSNTIIRIPKVDWFMLELRTYADGDFILIDKVVASQCNLNDLCKSSTTEGFSSTTTTEIPITTDWTDEDDITTSSMSPNNGSTSTEYFVTDGNNNDRSDASLKSRYLWVVLFTGYSYFILLFNIAS